jgi:hypothetical protein
MTMVEGNPDQPPISDKAELDPILRQLQDQDKMAMRRTIVIVAAILIVGAAAIGTVLGIVLTSNNTSSSSASVAFTYGPTIAPSESTDYPTFAPTTPPPTTKPTFFRRPSTSPAGLGFRPSFWVDISQNGTHSNSTKNSSRVPTQSPVRAPVAIPGPTAPTTPKPTKPPTISPIRRVLTNVSLHGGAEFNSPKSYQSKALAWLEGSSQSYTRYQLIQRYALGCIHFATSGIIHRFANPTETAWKNSTKWVSEAEECTWYGVSCNANMQVTGLRLNQNNLTGTFPNETILLANTLTVLEIGDNNIWNRLAQVNFLGKLVNLGKPSDPG